eukprot:gnl/MRDRNA2_/MRDRNA2_30421_c0_seq1.p1 gnl/MRDRNA2_/MRDRNA2_30421_c0~~gnl/MRDRNA2_/MRDRNA2_30421_c0_seq1.p1  ORF type:complete len:583 (+),score=98.62 gnl/MRDRNA2_/MRDRNA2_30421_c0_seq1:128-1876(+)
MTTQVGGRSFAYLFVGGILGGCVVYNFTAPGQLCSEERRSPHPVVIEVPPEDGGTTSLQPWMEAMHQRTASLRQQVLRKVVSVDSRLDVFMPSSGTDSYVLTRGTQQQSFSQWEQDRILWPILGNIKSGFFVESGALDGELGSNTLLYELQGWKGLLVEPRPKEFLKLKAKHRKAYAFHGYLSPSNETGIITYHDDEGEEIDLTAAPLGALLNQIGQKTVDFWSLDVDGSEEEVLKATDFSKIEFGVLLIQMNSKTDAFDSSILDTEAVVQRVSAIMKSKGFVDIGSTFYQPTAAGIWEIDHGEEQHSWEVLDHVFVNPKYFEARGLEVPTQLSSAGSNQNPLILRPASHHETYNLKQGMQPTYSQWQQDRILWPILGSIHGGFFVESSTEDEFSSNTLLYELHGWTGLIVEPNPHRFAAYIAQHRKTYAFHGALSLTKHVEMVRIGHGSPPPPDMEETESERKDEDVVEFTEVTAAPLHVLLEKIGRSVVDFWSLHVEGGEQMVLFGMDFKKIEVGVLLIDVESPADPNTGVESVMKSEGFIKIGQIYYNRSLQGCLIYVNPRYFEARGLEIPGKLHEVDV